MESPWPARFGLAKSGDPTLVIDAKGLKADTIRDVYFFPADWGPSPTWRSRMPSSPPTASASR